MHVMGYTSVPGRERAHAYASFLTYVVKFVPMGR